MHKIVLVKEVNGANIQKIMKHISVFSVFSQTTSDRLQKDVLRIENKYTEFGDQIQCI